MADNPIGGAGGFASLGSVGPGAADVSKVGAGAQSIARQDAGSPTGLPATSDATDAGKDAAQPPQTPALGAGGTSTAQGSSPDDDNPAPKASGAGRAAGAAAAVPVAGAAGQILLLAMFVNWLKGLLMSLYAIAANLWSLAVGLALAVAKTAVGVVMGVGATVSSALGGAISAAVAGTASFVAGGAVVVVVAVSLVTGISSGNALATKDGTVGCQANAQQALANVDGSNPTVDAQQLTNAKTIYSVLSAWGMPDENIAGILGNWEAESGVDPTSVQGDFSAPQQMTTTKQTEAADTNNGIGLGQWTFGRNQNLRDYASARGIDWWTIQAQLGFMISADNPNSVQIVKGMISTSQGSPSAAALYFHRVWEVSSDTDQMAQRRADNAVKWMGLFSGWTKDQALANSILAQAGTTVTGANSGRAAAIRANCLQTGAGQVMAKPGGLTLDEATALMALYKQEGESFLDNRYGAGGPGDCGYGKADNCVGFSTYFVNKYTSFQQYAPGNGKDTAGSMAQMMGKPLTKIPTAYSVGSTGITSADGHTFVVLGIQGDQAIIGQAACGTNGAGTEATTIPVSTLEDGDYVFVDVTDLITTQPATS